MPPLTPVTAAAMEEHRHLRGAVDELADVAFHTPPVAEGHAWCGDVASRLHDLGTRLDRHFRGEELEDGLYPQLTRALPDAAGQIRRLQEQHRRLLDVCRALAEVAATTPLDGEAFCRLTARIGALLAELASHEANESDLMLRVAQGEQAGPVR